MLQTSAAPVRIGQTHFRCISCGNPQNLLQERKFLCEICGDLLDVHTNYEPLGKHSIAELKQVFDNRAVPGTSPGQRSGVWRFKYLIYPEVGDDEIVSLGEGIIPIVPAGRKVREWVGGGLDLHFILEGQNGSGSFKDMGMTALATLAKKAGVSGAGCASTGDTSAALAAYFAAAGLPCFVLLPLKFVTGAQLTQPVAYGARVIGIDGDFDDCMRILNLLVQRFGVYPGNSLNPMRIAGHMATSFLLAQYWRWTLPDWIAAPVGNGSNTSSIGMGMRRLVDLGFVPQSARILGCQTESANPLARSWQPSMGAWLDRYEPMKAQPTIATATKIGAPVSFKKVIREVTRSGGAMQTASEPDIREAMDICLREGLPVCPQTGIAVAGLRNAVRAGLVKDGMRVAVVSTATTLKFSELYHSAVEKAVERAPDNDVGTVARMLDL